VELAGYPPWYAEEKGKQEVIVEGVAARGICWKGCICNSRILGYGQWLY